MVRGLYKTPIKGPDGVAAARVPRGLADHGEPRAQAKDARAAVRTQPFAVQAPRREALAAHIPRHAHDVAVVLQPLPATQCF